MYKFLLRMVINGLGLYAAISLVPGISLQDPDPVTYVWLALIFGLLNALVKPILKLVTCPVIMLTLGLFSLLINTALFYLTAWVGDQFGVGINIENFLAAFLGALIISIISTILNAILKDELKGSRKRKKN
ncbi:MAG: phage holin family protein [Chloroflexota bacterium]